MPPYPLAQNGEDHEVQAGQHEKESACNQVGLARRHPYQADVRVEHSEGDEWRNGMLRCWCGQGYCLKRHAARIVPTSTREGCEGAGPPARNRWVGEVRPTAGAGKVLAQRRISEIGLCREDDGNARDRLPA